MGIVLRARDPELDRDVAIKLINPSGWGTADSSNAERLQREAQAMAKLSHPNVVAVYEMGRVGTDRFIAMELVEGTTLRRWLADRDRPWREIVSAFVQCGRGLAAAHAAGLVHRDFKPENVLIGTDGRPRVSDFGLVASGIPVESDDVAEAPPDASLTVRGAVMGTPGYMAPEQWLGNELDARTDQFAFCVALWEALYRDRPFAGAITGALRENVLAGALRLPPRNRRVDRAIASVLQRGLARDREQRWPSMPELLAALDRPRRLWPWVATGAITTTAVIVTVAMWPRANAASCGALEERMVKVWDDPRRRAVDMALGDDAARVITPLDSYAETWVTARIEACEAARRGEYSADVRANREHCFEDALGQLDGVASAVASGTLSAPDARTAVANLPALARCSDLPALTSATPRPTDRGRAARLAELDQVLTRAKAALAIGRPADARELASSILADVEVVAHAPTLAAVLLVLGRAQRELGDNVAAEETLRSSLRTADEGRDDHVRLEAFMSLIDVVGPELGRSAEARVLLRDARGVLPRISTPTGYQARLLAYESRLVRAEGDDQRSLELLQQALPLYEEAFGTENKAYAELEHMLGMRLLAMGDVEGAEPLLDHARATLVEFTGRRRR